MSQDFWQLLQDVTPITPIKKGEMVKGTIIHLGKKHFLIDLNDQFTGLISGSDMNSSIINVRALKVGDTVESMVRGEDRNTGLVILSLRKASQVQLIERLFDNVDQQITMTVAANEANKGGLLVDLDGMKGFIPVSQLSPMNYPRVEGADPEKILEHLRGLVGKPLEVRVLNVDKEGKKIIFSERATVADKRQAALEKLKVGDNVEGVVSGILSYGLFVTFEGLEGLVHVSEIDWGHVSDPSRFAKAGDHVKVQIIGMDADKISLSMKRLKQNPWEALAKQFTVGDIIEAPVIKISKFGVFIEMAGGINGLIHLSEISHEIVNNVEDHVRVGQTIKAKLITLEPKEKRIGLSIKALMPAPEKPATPVVSEKVAPSKKEEPQKEAAKKPEQPAEKQDSKEAPETQEESASK